jgi:hypothetical protein
MLSLTTFAESNRLRELFSRESGGRFHIVFRALCDVSRDTQAPTLDPAIVVARIRELTR